jgi:hypothetical protein
MVIAFERVGELNDQDQNQADRRSEQADYHNVHPKAGRPEEIRKWHCHLNLARAACGRASSWSGDYAAFRVQVSVVPDVESIGADFAMDTGCQLMSAGTEVAVNEGVGGKERPGSTMPASTFR